MASPSIPISPPQSLPVSPAAAGAQNGALGNASLYVGDLDGAVTEADLFNLFSQVGPVLSIRVCRDIVRNVSLGYAYVNFSTPQEARRALEVCNFSFVKGKAIRIMFSHRDPSIRRSGFANVFIKNLDTSIDNKSLHDTFSAFGTVLSCKVATDGIGRSKGYGFVQFEKEESAKDAIKQLNGMLLNDKQVSVGLFVRRQERLNESPKFTNLYIKNLSEKTTVDDLKDIFGKHGQITSAVVMKDDHGISKGFGFINFLNADDATSAVEKLNGTTFDDKVLYVGKAQKKSEREAELKAKYDEERRGKLERFQRANLYLKNLDDSIDEEKLKELFSEFGTITSCKIMIDSQGKSKGSGFVAFSSPEEASSAVNVMNGKMVGVKPIYVAVAQRKEERRASLLAHFSQLRAPGMIVPMLSSGLHGYPSGARLPQQMYLGHGTPGIISPQPASYGFQQSLVPGIRPGISPNFIAPYNFQRQGNLGQRMGIRRGSHQVQYQQQRNGEQGFRYDPLARNGFDSSLMPQGAPSQLVPIPHGNTIPAHSIDVTLPQPVAINSLASTLASASLENQRLLLGEQLYPLVEHIEGNYAAKITGMLLEMDQTEVVHLIESPEALKKKVGEAMEVLRTAQSTSSDATNQLRCLSLNN